MDDVVKQILIGAAGDGSGGLVATFVTALLQTAGRLVRERFRMPERTPGTLQINGQWRLHAKPRKTLPRSWPTFMTQQTVSPRTFSGSWRINRA